MAASRLDGFIVRYGPVAGPKLYHALQSRAAFMGANARRRRAIAALSRRPEPRPHPDNSARVEEESAPLLAGFEPGP
jgi:hypothetical protein